MSVKTTAGTAVEPEISSVYYEYRVTNKSLAPDTTKKGARTHRATSTDLAFVNYIRYL